MSRLKGAWTLLVAALALASACPGNPECSGHGTCGGKFLPICTCFPGWYGAACDRNTPCPGGTPECSGHGKCILGICYCDRPYTGEACDKIRPPNPCPGTPECSGHGRCTDPPWCACDETWFGPVCNISGCPGRDPSGRPLECSGNGVCVSGHCECFKPHKCARCDRTRLPCA